MTAPLPFFLLFNTTEMKLKQLKVRPKKMLEASPCIVEMGALFECWATAGVNDSRCTAVAQSLTNCMQKPVSCASQKTGRRELLKNFFFS